jgi:ABC-2 type transport system permease protein
VRAWHIGMKDMTVTLRDKSALLILLAMPMVLILILGSALSDIGGNLAQTQVAIVNQDKGEVGAQVTDAFFTDSKVTELFEARRMRDPAEARDLVARGDLAGALVVPPDFSKKLNAGRPVKLTVYTDPGREISSAVFRGIAGAMSAQVSAASVAVRTTVHYAPTDVMTGGGIGPAIQRAVNSATSTEALSAVGVEERTAQRGREVPMVTYYAAGMSVMFMLFGSMFGAFSLARERADWTLPRILTAPVGKGDIIGGKAIGVYAVGLAQWVALYAFTLVLGVKWGEDVFALWLIALAMIGATTGLAMLFATVGTSVRAVSGVAPLAIQVFAIAGGSMFPVSAFPEWLKPLHYLTPNGWALDGILTVVRGGTLFDVWPSVLVPLAMGAAFFAVGVWRLRWR